VNNQIDIEDSAGKTIAHVEQNENYMVIIYTDRTFSVIRSAFIYDDLILENGTFYFDDWKTEMLLEHGAISQEWIDKYNEDLKYSELKRKQEQLERARLEYEKLKKEFGYD
jgi:hypothetical protein